MNDPRPADELTPSICKAALSRLRAAGDSLAGTCSEYDVGMQEFTILSLACDQEGLRLGQLCRALDLDSQSAVRSASRLIQAGLARAETASDADRTIRQLVPTMSGRLLMERILAG